jgi:hypothetical protein
MSLNKKIFEDIVNDVVYRHHGNKNTTVTICHSNGEKITTSCQYLITEDDYLKIMDRTICQYILYQTITAIYSDDM